jgi:hypothetical protein
MLGYQPRLDVVGMLEPLPAIVVEGERETEEHLLVRGVCEVRSVWHGATIVCEQKENKPYPPVSPLSLKRCRWALSRSRFGRLKALQ